MIIERIPITKINPAPYNPRKDLKPGDREYEKLKKSIKTFDLVEPLVWNKRTGNLVGGHQRLKIIQNEMGETEADVSVVDLSEKKEKALNIALNKIAGDWEMESLKELLVELDDGEFDLSLTGFDEDELKELIDYEGKVGLTDDDAVPETPNEPTTKRGDMYQIGQHRLMCGDSTEQEDVECLMDEGLANMVFTDPPYGVGYTGGAKKRVALLNDEVGTDIYNRALPHLRFAASDQAALYLWYADAHVAAAAAAAAAAGYVITAQVIWVKNNAQFVSSAHYHGKHEPCFYAHRKGRSALWYGQNNEVTVWEVDRSPKNEFHPTQKPVELAQRAMNNSSKKGDIVLDLFGGSGSTLIAAEKLNRCAYLMELDPAYCDVIVKRWEDFTGKKAELLKSAVPA